jgi:hypothetical protein
MAGFDVRTDTRRMFEDMADTSLLAWKGLKGAGHDKSGF